jgi:hypothetical protein
VFLLTNDYGTAKEAHEFFPRVKWKYVDWPHHNDSSGGMENQTPSRDPALEVFIPLSLFDLVQDCSTLVVQGPSGFTGYVYRCVSKGWVVPLLILLPTQLTCHKLFWF